MAANVEVKAICPDLAAARAAALALGAVTQGMEKQTDTFFRTPRGRLKLRESDRRGATLIPYLRPDRPQARQSDYVVLPVDDPAAAKRILSEALGVLAVVKKQREVLLLDNVRIHLDRVEGLGCFIELEAVMDRAADPAAEDAKVRALMAKLGIQDHQVQARAYVDLLG